MRILVIGFLTSFLFFGESSFASPIKKRSCQNIIEKISETYRAPARLTENSSQQLLASVGDITNVVTVRYADIGSKSFEFTRAGDLKLNRRFAKSWSGARHKQLPVENFLVLQAVIEKALHKQIGMSVSGARVFSWVAVRDVVHAVHEKWSDFEVWYQEQLAGVDVDIPLPLITTQNTLMAMQELNALVDVDRSHDIPYLAGYSKESAKHVYIDSGLITHAKAKSLDGRSIALVPFLVVHEAVEKALLLELPFQEKNYLKTHQLAQRIEKACVEATGVSWREYQHEIMKKEIQRSEDPQRVYTSVPEDLDLTPYLDERDEETIKKMVKAFVKPQRIRPSSLFTVKNVAPGVFYLHFDDQKRAAATLMRFQEHYESPHFRGQYFSRSEYRKWNTEQNGRFAYYDWDGFNIPSDVLTPFYEGRFPHLNSDEKSILETFRLKQHTSFYIIAAADDSDPSTLGHEIAHALFYFSESYRKEVLSELLKHDIEPIKKVLSEEVGDYHEAVLVDEVHAWTMKNLEDLKQDYGFDIEPYRVLSANLNEIFNRYANRSFSLGEYQ